MTQKVSKKRIVNGFLILNKPKGMTSNQALQKVRYLFSAKKAGHTGSLDPLATGVLPLCFGEATKFSQFLLNADKSYKVTAKLGIVTDTSDADGEVVETFDVPASLSSEQIIAVMNEFKGEGLQIPSMYSAIKFQGKPLYDYARRGITLERAERRIIIYAIEFLSYDASLHELVFTVHCSKGTYVRTLVEDIGKKLGCGAHVTELSRLSVGSFNLTDAIDLEEIEKNKHKFADLNANNANIDKIDKTVGISNTYANANNSNRENNSSNNSNSYINSITNNNDLQNVAASSGSFQRSQEALMQQEALVQNAPIDAQEQTLRQQEQAQQAQELAQERERASNDLAALKNLDKLLLPLNKLMTSFPIVELPSSSVFYLKNGNPVFVPKAPTFGIVSLYEKDTGNFLGIGEVMDDGKIAPKRLIN